MKEENKFLKIIVAILIILNLFISLKSLKLAIDYEALKIKNEDLEKVTEAQSSMISDLEENCRELCIEIENRATAF
jgi:hypothetical protein